MDITIRKKNSVTSAVLFVFNLLSEYKSEYSIRLGHLLEIMGYFGKSEVSVRTGLSRMVKAGLLSNRKEKGDILYALSEEGLHNVKLWNQGIARFAGRYELRCNGWDGQWHFLTVLDFNRSDYKNQSILETLRECGLREVNGPLWITPFPINGDVPASLEHSSLRYLVFKGNLDTNMDPEAWMDTVFGLTALRKKYGAFLRKINDNAQSLTAIRGGALLPILFETGWDYYDIVTSDAVLPKELLPTWEQDRAVEAMNALRGTLYREIFRFFDERNV